MTTERPTRRTSVPPARPHPVGRVGPARWALLSSVAGIVGNLLLVGFYVLATPWRPDPRPSEWDWLGPANDVAVVVQLGALLPVAAALYRRLPPSRASRGWTVVGVSGLVAVVVLQLLLVAGVLTFGEQIAPGALAGALVFGWMAAISVLAGRAGVVSRATARLGPVIGACLFGGAGVLAASLTLLPDGSAIRWTGFGIGGLVGLLGWVAVVGWTLLLVRDLSTGRDGGRP